MNDLFFIDYEAKVMLVDTLGMRADTELAHRRLCDYLWSTAAAPPNDDDALQDITRVSPQNWARVKGELMLKGWLVDGSNFLHRGALRTLQRCIDKHAERVESAKKAAHARWKKEDA